MQKSWVKVIDGARWQGKPVSDSIYAINWLPGGEEVRAICVRVDKSDETEYSEQTEVSSIVAGLRRYEDSRIAAMKIGIVATRKGPISFYRMTHTFPEFMGIYRTDRGAIAIVGFQLNDSSFHAEIVSKYLDKMFANGLLR